MAKALKRIEDKHKYDRTYGPQQRAGGLANSHTPANSQNKENQDTNSSTVMTSQPSPITSTTQIGNITVSDLATRWEVKWKMLWQLSMKCKKLRPPLRI